MRNNMYHKMSMLLPSLAAAGLLVLTASAAAGADLEPALAALKTYDWNSDRSVLAPIDQAVSASHGDAAARKKLESQLVEVLGSDASRAAKIFVCRKLRVMGSAASVPALASLLLDNELAHMARHALERMECPEAAKAMRDQLPKATGLLKVGIINSLGARRDTGSVGELIGLLHDSDDQVAAAGCAALGAIGSPEAAKALDSFRAKAPEALRLPAADGSLACAERLLADGETTKAMMIYKALATEDQPKHVRLAATRGMLAATGKK